MIYSVHAALCLDSCDLGEVLNILIDTLNTNCLTRMIDVHSHIAHTAFSMYFTELMLCNAKLVINGQYPICHYVKNILLFVDWRDKNCKTENWVHIT